MNTRVLPSLIGNVPGPGRAALALWLAWAAASGPVATAAVDPAAAAYESGQDRTVLRRLEQRVAEASGNASERAPVEADLNQLLTEPSTYEAKCFACQQLAILGTERSVPALAGLLNREETVGIACLALATIDSPKVDSLLRNALDVTRDRARVQVIQALGNRRDAGSVKKLLAIARARPDLPAREAAIAALGKIADRSARKAIASLDDLQEALLIPALLEARLRIAENLVARDERSGAISMYEDLLKPSAPAAVRRGAFAALLRLSRDGGEERILDTLRSSDRVLRPVAIASVRAVTSRKASARFASELPHLSPQEQAWMIESLADRADPDARAAIRSQLTVPETIVRTAAVLMEGRLGDATSVAHLVRSLELAQRSPDRRAVEDALVDLGGGPATDAAIVAELRPAPPASKGTLAAALARRGSEAAIPALITETKSANPAAARAGFQALGKLAGPAQLGALLDGLLNLKAPAAGDDAELAIAQVLLKVDAVDQRSRALLDAWPRAASAEARCSLLRLLTQAPQPDSFALLTNSLADAEPRVRDAAIRALAEWPADDAWSSLLPIYLNAGNESHRVLALRGLARLISEANDQPATALAGRYRQLLDGARTEEDRKMILGALSSWGHPDALGVALPLLANQNVRPEAESAVRKIAEAIKADHPQAAAEALRQVGPAR